MTARRIWTRRALLLGLAVLACHQAWRHGHDYVFADRFAEVEAGRIYRGAWQKDWPMRRIIRDRHIRTIVALAHPVDHPLPRQERALAQELGVRWVHVPIVDQRGTGDRRTVSDLLEAAAAELANPANQPVYFHCHHGINRASMVQMAYRMLYCGWDLERASAEIDHNFGLVEVSRGPDHRHMVDFYRERVLPRRLVGRSSGPTALSSGPETATARSEASSSLRK